MYKIDWTTTKNSRNASADIGDIHLSLKWTEKYWILSMGIRVYTQDHSRNMVRPHSTVETFAATYDIEEAKLKAEEYFTTFIDSVINDLIKE